MARGVVLKCVLESEEKSGDASGLTLPDNTQRICFRHLATEALLLFPFVYHLFALPTSIVLPGFCDSFGSCRCHVCPQK